MKTKRQMLVLLFGLGCALACYIICTAAVACMHIVLIEDVNVFLRLLCGLLVVALYPLFPLAGYALGMTIIHLSENDLRVNWIPLVLCFISVFCFGHLVFTGHAETLSLPGFLQIPYAYLTSQPSEVGMFCMLFSAPCIGMLTYAPFRNTSVASILKMLLQVFYLLVFVGLGCCWFLSGEFFFLISTLGAFFAFFGLVLFPILGVFIPKQFAWALNGQMKPYFPLMYCLSLSTLLFGVFTLLCNTVLPNYVHEMLKGIMPFVHWRYLAPFDDVGGIIIAIYLIIAGLLWVLSTIIVHCSRCPRCGGYDSDVFTETDRKSAVTGYVRVATHTLTNVRYYMGGHREDYDDQIETHERGTITTEHHHFCRYCGMGFGKHSSTTGYDTTVGAHSVGIHSEWHID